MCISRNAGGRGIFGWVSYMEIEQCQVVYLFLLMLYEKYNISKKLKIYSKSATWSVSDLIWTFITDNRLSSLL